MGGDLANGGFGQGIYTMNSGTLNVSSELTVSRNRGSMGSFTHSDGSVNVTGQVAIGKGDNGTGTYTISLIATLTTPQPRIAFAGDGVFQMDGGTVEVSGDIPIATPAGNVG